MAKTLLVVGFGPGISSAVAEKFGAAGMSVALVARSEERLAGGVQALKGKGIQAAAFPADASDPASIGAAVGKAREALGPIHAILWNAYGGREVGDLLGAEPVKAARAAFDVAIVGLLATVQAALPDLKETKGAVLVTNGAFGDVNPQVDAYAVGGKFMGLALGNAAKHKLVGLLSERLKADGIYVGEVLVTSVVKGTAWDDGSGKLESSAIADKYWELYQARSDIRARIG